MARALKERGLFSIMQVAKRAYWPTGMPAQDMVQNLGEEYGSHRSMFSTVPGESMMVVSFRDLKVKAIVSTCGVTMPGKTRRIKHPDTGAYIEFKRRMIFDEYEENKSSVDVANNRRDNLLNFHDVMCTQSWELRCLSFFLGVAEANAFSAFKLFHPEGSNVVHTEFRWRLAESLKAYISELRTLPAYVPPTTRSSRGGDIHSLIP